MGTAGIEGWSKNFPEDQGSTWSCSDCSALCGLRARGSEWLGCSVNVDLPPFCLPLKKTTPFLHRRRQDADHTFSRKLLITMLSRASALRRTAAGLRVPSAVCSTTASDISFTERRRWRSTDDKPTTMSPRSPSSMTEFSWHNLGLSQLLVNVPKGRFLAV